MKRLLLCALLLLLGVALLPAAWAQTCDPDGRGCLPTTDDCVNTDTTDVDLQVGGEGSVGTEDSCSSSPAKDAAGNVVEADVNVLWERTSETTGKLTLTIVNQTCVPAGTSDNEKATIMTVWWNTPDEIADCDLKVATVDGVNVCADANCTSQVQKGWDLSADAVGEGCLGDHDWMADANGKPDDVGALPGETLVLEMDCTGSDLQTNGVTACDIANDGSSTDPGERTATFAMHFQQLGCEQTSEGDLNCPLSNKVSSNCQEDLFVELASLTATPADGEVLVEWSTFLEIDNAGFYLVRRDTLTGEVARLNDALIPARGDIFQGAYYDFVDETAVNGVRYAYTLVDVDLFANEGIHEGLLAVANPAGSDIELVSPAYGSTELIEGVRPTFTWDGRLGRNEAALLISSDPAFESDVMSVAIRGKKDSLTLSPSQTRQMEDLARGNHDMVYWRIVETSLGSEVKVSPTYIVGYGLLSESGGRGNPSGGNGR